MKTVSNLQHTFFANADGQASAVLQKLGGFRQRGLQHMAQVSSYQLIPSGVPGSNTKGWGGSQRQAFSSIKTLILVVG